MWVPILVTLLVLAFALAPIMWSQPTPYQRRIAALRTQAAQRGLRVQLVPLSQLGVAGSGGKAATVAAYGLPWIQRAGDDNEVVRRPSNRPWCLVKGRMQHDLHFAGWWDWQKGKQADQRWVEFLRGLVEELPEDVIAVENNQQGLWLYWEERGGVERIDEIVLLLGRLKATGLSI